MGMIWFPLASVSTFEFCLLHKPDLHIYPSLFVCWLVALFACLLAGSLVFLLCVFFLVLSWCVAWVARI